MANPQLGKPEAGMGAKPDDAWCVPLCDGDHRLNPLSQHSIGESQFWERHKINPFLLALSLWKASPDDILMEGIIASFGRMK
jgi:hypothetical protein